jgi:tetratricopeptide (TPR) repeat protein
MIRKISIYSLIILLILVLDISKADDQKALELFAVGNSLLQSHIDRTVKWSDVLNQAVERYDGAIEQNPRFVEAYFNKGICYIRGAGIDRERSQNAVRCFEKVIEIKPDLLEAHFAVGWALYYIEAGDKAQGSDGWNAAVAPAIETFKQIISRFPNTDVAKKSEAMLQLIEWERKYGWDERLFGGTRLASSKPKRPDKPSLIPMDVEGTSSIQESVKEAISKIKTGIISDETFTISFRYADIQTGEYRYSGKVENTNGLKLHQFYTEIIAYNTHYDDTFENLYISFDYDGKTVLKKKLGLPDPGYVIVSARKGELPKEPVPVVEYENVKVSIVILRADADPNGPPRYKSLDIRVITEITE